VRTDMPGMIDFTAPLAGLNTAASAVAHVALNINKGGSPEDRIDLGQEIVALIQAQNDSKADATVIRTGDEINKSLLNITG
jgi:flagellar basal body rod protein FlgG